MFHFKRGVTRTFRVPIIKAGSQNFAVGTDWTPAAGDVKVIKDGGTPANIATLPTAVTVGSGALWEFTLTGTEIDARLIEVTIIDASTKAVEDQTIIIQTDNGEIRHGAAQDSAASTLVLDAAESSTNDRFKGYVAHIVAGRGRGQSRAITAYNGTTKTCTVSPNWSIVPGDDSEATTPNPSYYVLEES